MNVQFRQRFMKGFRVKLPMNKTLSLMGLAKKAGKLTAGHDAVMSCVKKGTASAVILTSDASPRHKKELENVGFRGKILCIEADMLEAGCVLGQKSCIFSVDDGGFSQAIEKTLTKEGFEDGCKIQGS